MVILKRMLNFANDCLARAALKKGHNMFGSLVASLKLLVPNAFNEVAFA